MTNLNPTILIATYFPTYEEFLTLYLTDIRTVYYFGSIEDEKTVKMLNAYTGYDKDKGFEIIQLLG